MGGGGQEKLQSRNSHSVPSSCVLGFKEWGVKAWGLGCRVQGVFEAAVVPHIVLPVFCAALLSSRCFASSLRKAFQGSQEAFEAGGGREVQKFDLLKPPLGRMG